MTLSIPARHGATINLARAWRDAPAFMGTAVLTSIALIPLLAAMARDVRLFQGESVWLKPVKFHLALGIYLFSLAFFARYLPRTMIAGRIWRTYAAVVCIAVLGELVAIGGAASLGIASHFNLSTPMMAAVYAVMGLGAVTLTSASLVMGVAIWRNPAATPAPALHLSIALGLVLTFVLTMVVAGFLSANDGHFVGVPTTGAAVPILGWSREVGDLRAAHFVATHALHGLPLVGWLAVRFLAPRWGVLTVWAGAVLYTGLVLGLFRQALSGLPVIG